jgi:hypothetical protein
MNGRSEFPAAGHRCVTCDPKDSAVSPAVLPATRCRYGQTRPLSARCEHGSIEDRATGLPEEVRSFLKNCRQGV